MIAQRYRVTRPIARGGMAWVCEAVHVATGRRVALKLIRDVSRLGDDREMWLERFRREARTIGVLQTPHIIDVFDAGTDDVTGLPFIAMELLQGSDLSRLLKRTGPLPAATALEIVRQACIALEQAHAAGVVHRDIKPGNLFLSEAPSGAITVKVVDFGIAKVGSENSASPDGELTQTGSLLGTPTYMSPEQARGLKTIDHRADLWALAVVLYRALSNRVPHPMHDGIGQVIVKICTEPSPRIQTLAAWVPAEIARILDRALQLDVELRYQSASELRADIERALGSTAFGLHRSMLRSLTDAERAERDVQYRSTFPPPIAAEAHLRAEPSTTASAIPALTAAPVRARPTSRWPIVMVLTVLGALSAIAGFVLHIGATEPPGAVPSVVAASSSRIKHAAQSTRSSQPVSKKKEDLDAGPSVRLPKSPTPRSPSRPPRERLVPAKPPPPTGPPRVGVVPDFE